MKMALNFNNLLLFIVFCILKLNHVLSHAQARLATLPPLKVVPQSTMWKSGKSIGLKECTDERYCTYYLPYDLDHLKTSVSTHPNIKKVIFEETSLGDEGAFSLASMLNLIDPLDLLSLNQNEIDSEGGAEIFRSTVSLGKNGPKVLSLERNNIRDGALRVLPGMVRRDDWCVEEINLKCNMIGSAGARSLASAFSINNSTSLQRLYLGGNPIGDDGVVALCMALMTSTSSQLTVPMYNFPFYTFSHIICSHISHCRYWT